MELIVQNETTWIGYSEIYDGPGKFIGYASDRREVTQIHDDEYNVSVDIIGSLMVHGNYRVKVGQDHHNYMGDSYYGYAEQINDELLTSNNYWSQWGLNETNYVLIIPDLSMQLSLSFLKRGEQLLYTLAGEYYTSQSQIQIPTVSGIPIDQYDNPTAGRSQHLLHRAGTWSGQLTVVDENLQIIGRAHYNENLRVHQDQIMITTEGGGFTPMKRSFRLHTNGWQSWTNTGDVVGSYSILGGRALTGHLHYIGADRRIWRREITTNDGQHKAILHYVYQGDRRVGIQYGLLTFKKT